MKDKEMHEKLDKIICEMGEVKTKIAVVETKINILPCETNSERLYGLETFKNQQMGAIALSATFGAVLWSIISFLLGLFLKQ